MLNEWSNFTVWTITCFTGLLFGHSKSISQFLWAWTIRPVPAIPIFWGTYLLKFGLLMIIIMIWQKKGTTCKKSVQSFVWQQYLQIFLNSFHMSHIPKVESKLSEALYRIFICIKFRIILTYISLPGFPLSSI